MTTRPTRSTANPHHGQMVWVPRTLHTGLGLQPDDLLVYVAGRDRADNQTGRLEWIPAVLAQRCALSKQTVRAALKRLATAGLVVVEEQGPGKPYIVTFPKIPYGQRLEFPLAALWEATTGGPRFGSLTGQALRALLVLLHRADFVSMTTADSASKLAGYAGVSVRQYERWWQVLRDGAPDWVLTEQTYTDLHGRASIQVTLDWNALPPMTRIDRVTPVTPSIHVGRGVPSASVGSPSIHVGRGVRSVSEPNRTSVPSLSPVPTSFPPADQPTRATATTEEVARMEDGHTTCQVTDLASRRQAADDLAVVAVTRPKDEVGSRLTSVIAEAGGRSQLGPGSWAAVAIANIVHADTDPLPITAANVRSLVGHLDPFRMQGWDPVALAEALTADSGQVKSPMAVLKYRLRRMAGSSPLPATTSSDLDVWPRPRVSASRDWGFDFVAARIRGAYDPETFRNVTL